MSKFEDFITEEQFTEDAKTRTKQILEIVVGGVDAVLLEKARAGQATEEEMARVIAGMFAGQAAIFQALHTNVITLGKHGLIDPQTANTIAATVRAMNMAVQSGVVGAASKSRSGKTAEIIPFPGSQKVH